MAEAEKRNRHLRAQGLPTPHQLSQQKCLEKKRLVGA